MITSPDAHRSRATEGNKMSKETVADYCNLFVGNRQISVSHFYPIGKIAGNQCFSVGYTSPDDVYITAIYWHDEQGFHKHDAVCVIPG